MFLRECVYTHTRLSFFLLSFLLFILYFFSPADRTASPLPRPLRGNDPRAHTTTHNIQYIPSLLSPYVGLPPSNVCAIWSTMNDDAGAPIPTDALFVPPSPSKRKEKKKGKSHHHHHHSAIYVYNYIYIIYILSFWVLVC